MPEDKIQNARLGDNSERAKLTLSDVAEAFGISRQQLEAIEEKVYGVIIAFGKWLEPNLVKVADWVDSSKVAPRRPVSALVPPSLSEGSAPETSPDADYRDSKPGYKLATTGLTIGDVVKAIGISEKQLGAFAQQGYRVLESFTKWLEPNLRAAAAGVERLEAAPEVPGYEPLLRNEFGYHPLYSRLLSYFLLHLGRMLQAEKAQGRRVGALVRQISLLSEDKTLAISRRAIQLKALCANGRGGPAIDAAISRAKLELERSYFDDLLERAGGRDFSACSELYRVSAMIAHHTPDPRGRAISRARTTHELIRAFMAASNRPIGYTYNDYQSDYTDRLTKATRSAFNESRFCPRRAKPRPSH